MIFVFTEVMFFFALISAFLVIKANNPGSWDLPENIRLPVVATGFNTLVLIASGFFLFRAGRQEKQQGDQGAVSHSLLVSAVLGLFFVGFQGFEWVKLIRWGMTLRSDLFSSCFYLLIGSHAVHALSGALAMLGLWWLYRHRRVSQDHIYAMQVFWFFVVGVWPIS